MAFKTILCAVPALSLVDPVRISAPVSVKILMSETSKIFASGLLLIPTVTQPVFLAVSIAATTYAEFPAAEIPTTTSPDDTPYFYILASVFVFILFIFTGTKHTFFSARNNTVYRVIRYAKRWRALRSIDNAEDEIAKRFSRSGGDAPRSHAKTA